MNKKNSSENCNSFIRSKVVLSYFLIKMFNILEMLNMSINLYDFKSAFFLLHILTISYLIFEIISCLLSFSNFLFYFTRDRACDAVETTNSISFIVSIILFFINSLLSILLIINTSPISTYLLHYYFICANNLSV